MSVEEVTRWIESAAAERHIKKLEWLIPMLIVEVQAEIDCVNPSETCYCLCCQPNKSQVDWENVRTETCQGKRLCTTCEARVTKRMNV